MDTKHVHAALARRYYRAQWSQQAKRVLLTPALRAGHLDLVVLSMLHPRDLLAYLVAIKSFHRFVPSKRIVLVADPALLSSHISILKAHIPFLQVLEASDFRHPDYPAGGTWERLAAICTLRRESYVIQLDADTVTQAAVPEVERCIKSDTSFVMGTVEDQSIGLFQDIVALARRKLLWSSHVQLHCEAALLGLSPLGLTHYVRGCSGFSGFSKNADALDTMRAASRLMSEQIEGRWADWGTEQFMSNLLVANDAEATVLPYRRYGDPLNVTEQTAFTHFIGYLRHESALYTHITKQIVADLRAVTSLQFPPLQSLMNGTPFQRNDSSNLPVFLRPTASGEMALGIGPRNTD